MDTPDTRIADHQRRALEFMLDALGLRPPAGEVTRLLELSHTVIALLEENRRLRRELRELEAKLDPEAAEAEAFASDMDSRLAGERGGTDGI